MASFFHSLKTKSVTISKQNRRTTHSVLYGFLIWFVIHFILKRLCASKIASNAFLLLFQCCLALRQFCFDMVTDFVLSEWKKLAIKAAEAKKKKRNWFFFLVTGGSEILYYERVDSFGNLILAICKSWQIEVEAELLGYA